MVGAYTKSGTISMIVEFVDINGWVYATDRSDPRHETALELSTRLTRNGNGALSIQLNHSPRLKSGGSKSLYLHALIGSHSSETQ